MGRYFYTGGPQELAGGARAQRQVGALGKLAGIPGKVLRAGRAVEGEQTKLDSEEEALNVRLGRQTAKAEAESSHPDDVPSWDELRSPEPAGATGSTGPSPTPSPAGQSTSPLPGDRAGGMLGRLGKLAGLGIGANFGLSGGPERGQAIRTARLRGEVARHEDQRKLLGSLAGVTSTAERPSDVARAVAPDLGIPSVDRYVKPENEKPVSAASLALKAAGGDARKALELLTQQRAKSGEGPLREYDEEEDTTDDVTGLTTHKVKRRRKPGTRPDPNDLGDAGDDVVHGIRLR